MATVASYFAVLGLAPDKASFALGDKLLSGVATAVSSLGGVIAGAFALGAVTNFVGGVISSLPAINDLAKQTGFSAEEIQRLGFAAGQSGADMGMLSVGLLKFTKNIAEASKGGKEAADAFAAVGISTDGIAKRDPRDVLAQFANGLKKIPEVAKRAEVAASLFGLSGAKLAPFLALGEDALAKMGDEATNLGMVLSGETIAAVDDLDDRINKAQATFKGAGTTLVVSLLPVLEQLVDLMQAGAVQFTRIPKLIKRFSTELKVAAGVVGTLLVGKLVIATAAFVATNVAMLTTAATAGAILPGAFFATVAAIDLATAAAGRFLLRLAAMILPALAVGAAISLAVLIIDDLLTLTRGGDSLIGALVGRFGELSQILMGIVDDPEAHPLVRFLAAIGVGVATALEGVDLGIEYAFRALQKIIDLGDFIIALFTNPVETLRTFFTDALFEFSAFINKASELAGKVGGFFGIDGLGSSLGGDAGSLARGSGLIPAVTSAPSSSQSLTVGAPTVNVNVTANTNNPQELANVVGSVGADAVQRSYDQAAVDLLAGEG